VTAALSIVVVSWNTRDTLARCLESLFADTFCASAEIWVVDNASADGSAEMVRRKFPGVRLLANRENRGYAAACNQALALATGEIAVLLNADAAPQPGSLPRLTKVLRSRPDVGVVGGMLVGPEGRPRRSYGAIPRVRSFVAEMLWLEKVPGLGRIVPTVASPPRRHERARAVGYVSGACLAFRRNLMEVIGPLDERFFLYFEETDFCLRARRDAGLHVWFEPEARVRHEGGASTRQCSEEAEVHYARSASAFIRKHHGPRAATRLAAILRSWLALHVAVHRLKAAVGDPRAREAIARKQRLRRLHRSLEAGETSWGWAG
jgi:N-acetylglucosaminyl-diphospho-decaprenol L-rhamnosyltransferase